MRQFKVKLRPEARADLLDIYLFVYHRSRNAETARRFVKRMEASCKRIGLAPYGGRPRDDLEPGLRTAPFERSAVIAYRIVESTAQITNVFYGGQDYEAFYRRSSVGGVDPESD